MFMELAQFVSFLLLILTLCALFHQAFLALSLSLPERLMELMKLFVFAAGLATLSGQLFRTTEQRLSTTRHSLRLTSTFPMQVFLWTSTGIAVLFFLAWLFETYLLPWSHTR